jgi:prepilin-type N-terminal cleavage/methylation domain-containing protein
MSTRTQQGYSLLEMMIALAATLVVAAAAFGLMRSSLSFANTTYNVTEAEQSLRSAHEVINRDLTKAGDGLRGIGTINAPTAFVSGYLTRTPVPDCGAAFPCVGLVTSDNSIPASTAIPQASPAANFLSNSDRISMIVRDTDFNLGNSVSIPVGKLTISAANTNIVVNTTAEINLFHAGEIYALTSQNYASFFVVSAVNTTTKTITITNGDGYGINANSATSPIYLTAGVTSSTSSVASSIMRLQIIQYFVTDTNLLMRRVIGVANAGFLDTVVAEHVTNMRFRYLTNLTDANGFVRQPLGNLSLSGEQSAVRQVETTLGVETLRAVNAVTNSNSASTACGANPNGKQNICSTTSTTVRNLQFRTAL